MSVALSLMLIVKAASYTFVSQFDLTGFNGKNVAFTLLFLNIEVFFSSSLKRVDCFDACYVLREFLK